MSNQSLVSRQPSGIPVGGQFAARQRGEGDVDLPGAQTPPVGPGGPGGPAVPGVGPCPDCGSPMPGQIVAASDDEPAILLPGSTCAVCGHAAAGLEHETENPETGETWLNTLEEDASIRVVDEGGETVVLFRPEHGHDWAEQLDGFGLAGQHNEIRAALRARNDPWSQLEKTAKEAGLESAVGAYEIILDRERIPVGHLLTLTADDVDSHYSTYIGPAVDALGTSHEHGDDLTSEGWARVEKVCENAGLRSMTHFYQLLADRDELSERAARRLDRDMVASDYEVEVAPRIDQLEDRLLRDFRTERADAIRDHLWPADDDDDVARAWVRFENSSNEHEDLVQLADEIDDLGTPRAQSAAMRLRQVADAVD